MGSVDEEDVVVVVVVDEEELGGGGVGELDVDDGPGAVESGKSII